MNSDGNLREECSRAQSPDSLVTGQCGLRRIRFAVTLCVGVAGLLASAASCQRDNGSNGGPQPGRQATTGPDEKFLTEPAFLPTATADDFKQEALRAAKELLEAYPHDINALQIAAGLHSRLGDSDEAVRIWRLCLEIDPNYVAAYSSIGNAAQQAGDLEEAAKMFERVIALAPSELEPPALLADVLLKLGRPEEAVAILQDRVRGEVVLDMALLVLGQAYLQLEEYEKARETFQRLLDAAPRNARAYYGLARVYAKLGRSDESRQSLEKFKSFTSLDHEARARDLRTHVDPKTARTFLVETLIASGLLYRGRQEPVAAELAWRKVAALESGNLACRHELFYLYDEQNRDRDALGVCEELCKIEPENVEHWYNAGLLNARLDRFDAALAALQQAIRLDPKDSRCRQAYEMLQRGR